MQALIVFQSRGGRREVSPEHKALGVSEPIDSEVADLNATRIWLPVTLYGSIILFALLAYGLYSWRIRNFPHAVATITEVWEKQVRVSRGRSDLLRDLVSEPEYRTVTMGRIRFTRAQRGKTYDCAAAVQLGVPSDVFRAGEKLEVVPATGTCQRVDIVRRLQ